MTGFLIHPVVEGWLRHFPSTTLGQNSFAGVFLTRPVFTPTIQNQRDTSGLDPYKRRRMLPAALTTLLFSLSAICSNRTAKLMGGIEANFWRLCFGSLLLGIYAHSLGTGLTGAALP
ncbi:MAG TPA: hypothetical protein VNH84_18025, partial [Candidatus Saccharimonadales bacterium]|nr:hypothetical protein [Candidatus Saccharimonadales bacterium]